MTGTTPSHITARSRKDGIETTRTYAVNENAARDLCGTRDWLGGYLKLSGRDLMAWLPYKGCLLDSPHGPAVIRRGSDSSFYQEYWRNGKLHREDGPAVVWRSATGATEDSYYRDGKRHRDGGPAFVRRGSDGQREERYYREGKLVEAERQKRMQMRTIKANNLSVRRDFDQNRHSPPPQGLDFC
jgi:hypothetical protein